MHELSIARNVVEVAAEAVRGAGGGTALTVRLRIGVLSGIAPEALAFCYDVVTRGTPLEGSRLVMQTAPVVLYCAACAREVAIADPCRLACPACGTPTADVRGGRELEVESVEVT